MHTRYEGSFQLKNAVIRARFTGDKNSHSFYIGEHDTLSANVLIGKLKSGDEELMQAFMRDGRVSE
jgi:hypothetical protein